MFGKDVQEIHIKNKTTGSHTTQLSPCVAETIYKVMILSQILYCSYIMFGMSNTRKLQFERIRKRVSTIINGKSQRVSHGRNRKCIIDIFKCQNGLALRISNEHSKKVSVKKILVKITVVFCFQRSALKLTVIHSSSNDQSYLISYRMN